MTGCMFALFPCLLLFSCSKEFPDGSDAGHAGKYSESISFGVAPDGPDGNVQTKGVAAGLGNGYVSGQFVLRAQDSADTLCVRATVADGIHSSGGRQAVTRATPVAEENFYDAFHVLAYWKKDGQLVQEQFYMDEDVFKNGNNLWSATANTYYWPGDGHTLRFCAWAPADAAFSLTPQDPTSTSLAYTVPKDVADQKDIVVTSTDEMAGNSNTVVPLDFRHICTAVQFKFGSQMQSGTVKSVALKGVGNAGTYDMASGKWTLSGGTDDFMQELNLSTTGSETSGSELTTPAQTFMMIPQETLPDGASVEVVFNDGTKDRTLSASIAGMVWPQGKTVTYRISISPEYEFRLSDERTLDAHYEIYMTNIVVTDLPAGKQWTVTAGDNVTIQSQSGMNSFARQGYWTDRNVDDRGNDTGTARGNASYSGTGSGEFPVAIFVPENTGDSERTLKLSVAVDGKTVQTMDIVQYAPAWYAESLGCERIQGPDCPWGFYWTDDFALIYDLTSCNDSARETVREYVEWTKALHTLVNLPFIGGLFAWIFGDDIPDLSYVDMEKSDTFLGLGGKADEVTINLGEIHTAGIATSPSDGQANTQAMYNFEGIQFVNEIINSIESIPGYSVTTRGEGTNPSNNAAIACMKLNSWNIITVESNTLLTLTNDNNTADWYLPSMQEINGIADDINPISGEYWTSTAVDDNRQAYKYSGGSTPQELRDKELHVRAVRKRP